MQESGFSVGVCLYVYTAVYAIVGRGWGGLYEERMKRERGILRGEGLKSWRFLERGPRGNWSNLE